MSLSARTSTKTARLGGSLSNDEAHKNGQDFIFELPKNFHFAWTDGWARLLQQKVFLNNNNVNTIVWICENVGTQFQWS